MKAEELRIGNLLVLSDTGESFTVTGMMLDSHGPKIYGQTYSGEYCSPRDNQCKPVILTEDWLLRAGFRKTRKYPEIYDKNVFILETNLPIKLILCGNKGFFDCYSDYNPSFKKHGINFITTNSGVTKLHQLQNLYFALTGNELTFADPHNPCTSDDPDDMCKNCNCWKSTRKNCS